MKLLLIGAGAAFAMSLVLMLASASPASAAYKQFCWGETLTDNYPCDSYYHDGIVGYIDEVGGSGLNHAVCVFAWFNDGVEKCSGGPNQGVYNTTPTGSLQSIGAIRNATGVKGNNKVYAYIITCPEKCTGGESPPPSPLPSWHSENFGGFSASDPEICSWGPSHIDIFVRGSDNALWHKYWDGTSWSNWGSLGGNLASAPGCVAWGPNRIDVVARASDNSVIQWWWNGSVWQSGNLGGNIAGDPDIASWGSNRLDVFGRASDGSIAHKAWNGSSWSSWENLGGAGAIVSGVGAVGSGGNRIDVVGRAANNSVFHLYYYNGWYTQNDSGVIKGDPDVSSWGSGSYNIWVRGSDDGLFEKWWTGSAWTNWESALPAGSLASSPGAVSFQSGRHDLVSLDANGSIRHWWWCAC